MKHRIAMRSTLAALVLTWAFFLAARAGAQGEEPVRRADVEVGFVIGRFYGGNLARGSSELFDRKVAVDDDVLKGFWIGARLPGSWSLEAAVRRTPTKIVEANGGLFPESPELAGIDVASIELLVSRAWPHGDLAPYAGVGAGLVNLDINLPDRARLDSNRGALSLAAGLRFDAAPRVSLRFELRSRATYLGRLRAGEDDGWHDGGRWFVDHEITVGAAVVLGRW